MEHGKLAIWPAAPDEGKPKSGTKVLVASLFKIKDLEPSAFAGRRQWAKLWEKVDQDTKPGHQLQSIARFTSKRCVQMRTALGYKRVHARG